MKKSVLLIFIVMLPFTCMAQYVSPYYPYNSYQQQQQAMQNAYNYGRKLREEYLNRIENEIKSDPNRLWENILYCLNLGFLYENLGNVGDPNGYEHAYEYSDCLAHKHNYALGYLMLGYMKETGIGTSRNRSMARRYFQIGADMNDAQCKKELQRIDEGNYYTEEDTKTIKYYFSQLYAQSQNGGDSSVNILNWNNRGSSNSQGSTYSSGNTCPSCSGTGTCSSCHGTGGEYRETGYYTGSYSKTWIDCPSCRGSKRCYNCHGKGRI